MILQGKEDVKTFITNQLNINKGIIKCLDFSFLQIILFCKKEAMDYENS